MSEQAHQRYFGQCHCGNISYHFETEQLLEARYSRECQCEFCLKHHNLYQSDPEGKLVIDVRDAQQLSRYEFGHKTAQFLICRHCGLMPVATSEIDGTLYAVINVNCLEPRLMLSEHDAVVPVTYSNEASGSRIARRKKNWIGDVTLNLEMAQSAD